MKKVIFGLIVTLFVITGCTNFVNYKKDKATQLKAGTYYDNDELRSETLSKNGKKDAIEKGYYKGGEVWSELLYKIRLQFLIDLVRIFVNSSSHGGGYLYEK